VWEDLNASNSTLLSNPSQLAVTQELKAIDVDCDSDALRFTVRQKGTPPVSSKRVLAGVLEGIASPSRRPSGLTFLFRSRRTELKICTSGLWRHRCSAT
jgi:hypothetical protein